MPDSKQLAHDFVAALVANEPVQFEQVLTEDVGLRLWRWDGGEAYRPRERVVRRLMEEWSSWQDPNFELLVVLAEDSRAAIEFRIYATERERYIEHNRSAFLTILDGRVQTIDLFVPSHSRAHGVRAGLRPRR